MISSFKVTISPVAYQSIDDALDYYSKISSNVAKDFVNEVDSKIKSLSRFPYRTHLFDKFHTVPLKRFPYKIIYKIDSQNNIITIEDILHFSKNTNFFN